jgi:hypothetical protein
MSTTQIRTPRLDVHGDNRLSGGLDLASFLLVVLGQTLSLELLRLLVHLVLVAAEQVNLVIVLLSSRRLGGIDRQLGLLGTIGGVVLCRIAGQSGELRLPGEDVVVPAPGVGELLRRWDRLQLLEDLDIGLRWGIAIAVLALFEWRWRRNIGKRKRRSEVRKRMVLYSDSGVLSRLINTDQIFSSQRRVVQVRKETTGDGGAARHLPNDVAASLDPVVQEGKTGIGDKIGEAHGGVWWCSTWDWLNGIRKKALKTVRGC